MEENKQTKTCGVFIYRNEIKWNEFKNKEMIDTCNKKDKFKSIIQFLFLWNARKGTTIVLE